MFRILNNSEYKERILKFFLKTGWFDQNIDFFIEELLGYKDHIVIMKVNNEINIGDVIVLLSASFDIYVSKIASTFGWIGFGSKFENNKFFHMYGSNKSEFLLKEYPVVKYKYKFAISDSKSDILLLEQFAKWELYK